MGSCSSESKKVNVAHIPERELNVLPKVVKIEVGDLEKSLIDQGLVDIQNVSPNVLVDLKYSTTDNFFKRDVYGTLTKAFLPTITAKKLSLASDSLVRKYPEFRLMVFDAVRPHSVQKILWEALDSIPSGERRAYVADPAEGSLHNYGCAVDLSIYNVATDTLLDMGTSYDFFGYLAYPRKEQEMLESGQLSKVQIKNRSILREVMIGAGFMPITSEWWHFNSTSLARAKKEYLLIK